MSRFCVWGDYLRRKRRLYDKQTAIDEIDAGSCESTYENLDNDFDAQMVRVVTWLVNVKIIITASVHTDIL